MNMHEQKPESNPTTNHRRTHLPKRFNPTRGELLQERLEEVIDRLDECTRTPIPQEEIESLEAECLALMKDPDLVKQEQMTYELEQKVFAVIRGDKTK